ncbi:MAG: shikimate kinase [Rhodobacteraceae bacterium]|nr:shikimate kinase [Paracoccaceae bacterium]
MAWQLTKTIALVGLMGAGKTAVGTAVAGRLGVPFLDTDQEIERAASMTISEIFERDGEAFFREKEEQVLRRLMSGPSVILGTGGGAYLRDSNRAIISETGVALWLKADLPLLWSRIKHKTTRPLLRTADPCLTLSKLLYARDPCYAQAEFVTEAKAELSIDRMAERVIKTLADAPGSGLKTV